MSVTNKCVPTHSLGNSDLDYRLQKKYIKNNDMATLVQIQQYANLGIAATFMRCFDKRGLENGLQPTTKL